MHTVFSLGGIYAGVTFGMALDEVIVLGIALNVTAGLGAFVFGWMDDKRGSKSTIMVSLVALVITSAIALSATDRTTFWIAALAMSTFFGPVQARKSNHDGAHRTASYARGDVRPIRVIRKSHRLRRSGVGRLGDAGHRQLPPGDDDDFAVPGQWFVATAGRKRGAGVTCSAPLTLCTVRRSIPMRQRRPIAGGSKS